MGDEVKIGNPIQEILSRNTTTENEDNTGFKGISRNNTTRKCAASGCNNEFVPKQWNHKYCSDECRAHGNGFESVEHVKKAVKRKQKDNKFK